MASLVRTLVGCRTIVSGGLSFLIAWPLSGAESMANPVAPLVAPLTAHVCGGETNLILPDLSTAGGRFLGLSGHDLLLFGLAVCLFGLLFGLTMLARITRLPVHRSLGEVSELIFATCRTYLAQQCRFLALLWLLIAAILVAYFGFLTGNEQGGCGLGVGKVAVILACSIIGILGSVGVAWFGIRINTLANGRVAFAALRGRGYACHQIPLMAGMSIGTLLISVELAIMLAILLFLPSDLAGPCFIGFAIGESLGAMVLRIAGGIFTKIADIGSDLMKIVFKVKEDDARNPGVIADCTGDNAGDSVGPTADGFETYGVTGVALITFILLAVNDPAVQVQLLVWIFVLRVAMVLTSIVSYVVNDRLLVRPRFGQAVKFNFETPLSSLVLLTSLISVAVTFVLSSVLIPVVASDAALWWQLALIVSCGTVAGAFIPEVVKAFTSTRSQHVREIITASREGGASLNILAGLTAGNFSAYWLGLLIVALMGTAYGISTLGLGAAFGGGTAGSTMAGVFAFGLVAFGFLGMGPVTIAVDSYGPVTDNAQSVYELSTIEQEPGISADIEKSHDFTPNFTVAKELLEENDGAGNTFKATAKPVLIGTAVVGATTMIFSIIMELTGGLGTRDPSKAGEVAKLALTYAPFLLGIITGGAVIHWFAGATIQAVVAGAYKAVDFIKHTMRLDGGTKASVADSQRVVEICTRYAQNGMWNIFLAMFFATLAFACVEPFFFIGYLIGLALIGFFQAVFMANAGGAWDNAKKVVETELAAKGTALHDASIVGDTVGDPFKDTSSVAINPVIKFSTLFGLLAVMLAVTLDRTVSLSLAAVFFAVSVVFVWRSFYAMRIGRSE
jgi:K(+)-stimulated pyrophosphate-energized sodium pump